MAVENLVRPNIQKLTPYSSARSEFKGIADIFLDANENPFETGYNRYPDPLQRAVKNRISTLKGIPAENIFLGNGSDEVIDLLIRIFCEPREDHILILPPTYGMYQVSAGIADVAIREIPLTEDFQPKPGEILAAANTKSKILFLCSPNNPTGNSFDSALVKRILEEFSGIVVVDEAYIDFSEQDSFIQLIAEYPNLVVMQTFSKAWGLAGIRLGMGFASEEIVALFNKVKPPYNINQLTQQAALEALQNEQQQQAWVDEILEERSKLEKALDQLSFVQYIYPSDANFILVKMDDPVAVYDYLIAEGIIVRNRSKVLMCEGCLRITIGTLAENKNLIAALEKYK